MSRLVAGEIPRSDCLGALHQTQRRQQLSQGLYWRKAWYHIPLPVGGQSLYSACAFLVLQSVDVSFCGFWASGASTVCWCRSQEFSSLDNLEEEELVWERVGDMCAPSEASLFSAGTSDRKSSPIPVSVASAGGPLGESYVYR